MEGFPNERAILSVRPNPPKNPFHPVLLYGGGGALRSFAALNTFLSEYPFPCLSYKILKMGDWLLIDRRGSWD